MKLVSLFLTTTLLVSALPGSLAKKKKGGSSKKSNRGKTDDNFVQLRFDRDLCLTIDPEEYDLVHFVDCGSTEYEAWYYDNGKIKNKHDDYNGWCLMGSSNGESGYPEMTLCSHTDPS